MKYDRVAALENMHVLHLKRKHRKIVNCRSFLQVRWRLVFFESIFYYLQSAYFRPTFFSKSIWKRILKWLLSQKFLKVVFFVIISAKILRIFSCRKESFATWSTPPVSIFRLNDSEWHSVHMFVCLYAKTFRILATWVTRKTFWCSSRYRKQLKRKAFLHSVFFPFSSLVCCWVTIATNTSRLMVYAIAYTILRENCPRILMCA